MTETEERIQIPVKVPKNKQSRMADDVWLAGEAIARHFRMTSPREGFEAAVRDYVLRLAQQDPRFSDLWEKVKEEGIEAND